MKTSNFDLIPKFNLSLVLIISTLTANLDAIYPVKSGTTAADQYKGENFTCEQARDYIIEGVEVIRTIKYNIESEFPPPRNGLCQQNLDSIDQVLSHLNEEKISQMYQACKAGVTDSISNQIGPLGNNMPSQLQFMANVLVQNEKYSQQYWEDCRISTQPQNSP